MPDFIPVDHDPFDGENPFQMAMMDEQARYSHAGQPRDRFGNVLSGGGGGQLGGSYSGKTGAYPPASATPISEGKPSAPAAVSAVDQIKGMLRQGKSPADIMKSIGTESAGYGDPKKNLITELSRNGMPASEIFDLLEGK